MFAFVATSKTEHTMPPSSVEWDEGIVIHSRALLSIKCVCVPFFLPCVPKVFYQAWRNRCKNPRDAVKRGQSTHEHDALPDSHSRLYVTESISPPNIQYADKQRHLETRDTCDPSGVVVQCVRSRSPFYTVLLIFIVAYRPSRGTKQNLPPVAVPLPLLLLVEIYQANAKIWIPSGCKEALKASNFSPLFPPLVVFMLVSGYKLPLRFPEVQSFLSE